MSAGKVSLVFPRRGLIEAVVSRLRPEGKDYSADWIVFPERRPAYYLRQALAAREGTGFIPPRIDSMDAFVDHVYEEKLGCFDRAIDALDAVAVLFEIHKEAPDLLGGKHFLTADQFFPLGTRLYRDLEELASGGVTAEALRRRDGWSGDAIPAATQARLQSLSFFFERFYEEITARGLSTPAGRLRAVSEGIRPDLFRDSGRIIMAGFYPLAAAEAGLIKTMLGWASFELLLLEGKGIEEVLDRLGVADPDLRTAALKASLDMLEKEDGRRADPVNRPVIEFIKSPDTHGQVFALNAFLGSGPADPVKIDEKTVIVLPASETLFPLYQQTLSGLAPEAFNISMGYPLARTPIYSFFDKLLELLQSEDAEGRVYAPHYLRFVLHPYTKNIYFAPLSPGVATEASAASGKKGLFPAASDDVSPYLKRADLTRILFHAIEEELTERRTRAFWALEEIEGDEGVSAAVQELSRNVEGAPSPEAFREHLHAIHATLIAPFRDIMNVGDFAAKLAAVLEGIYAGSTARLHYFFHPYAEAFRRRLDALGRSLLRDTVFEDRASYFNLFRKVAQAGTVPFEGTPLRGLQVLGFWETRCIPFEDVLILDANEDVLPSSRRTDSLLPPSVRLGLGLPTYRQEERRVEYYLDTILRGARRVRLFFVENDDRERSRYVEKLIWEGQKREAKKNPQPRFQTVRYEVALQTGTPEPIDKTPAVAAFLRGFTYSATALDAYLACPLRFYFAYVLHLREREEIGEQVEKKDIGAFVHSILEEYFTPWIGKIIPAGGLNTSVMDALVERRFQETFGRDLSGGAYLMKLQAQRQLKAFLTDYQEPIVAGLASAGRHLRLIGLEKKVDVQWRGLKLTAKIDRAERRGDDLFILDYKTSADTKVLGVRFDKLDLEDRASWCDCVASVQLPFYNLVLSKVPIDRGEGAWENPAGELIHLRRENPIFKSGTKAPLSINPGHAPGFVSKSRGFNRVQPALIRFAIEDCKAGSRMGLIPADRIQCRLVMLGRHRLSPGIEFSAYSGGKEMKALEQVRADGARSAVEKAAALSALNAEISGRIVLMQDLIGRLLDEIADPAIPFDPALQREGACGRCPYTVLCGRAL